MALAPFFTRTRVALYALVGLMVCAGAVRAQGIEVSSTYLIQPGNWVGPAQVGNTFGCNGSNISPLITWSAGPVGTRYYALTLHDADAPVPGGFWHWQIINIPATITTLLPRAGNPHGPLPQGALQTANSNAEPFFLGPCPLRGDKPHRYTLTMYALSAKLPLSMATPPELVNAAIQPLALASGTLTGTFGR